MKKVIALILALCFLSIGMVGFAAIRVNANKDTVTIREYARYGNSALAHGLSIQTLAHYDDHLYWDIRYDLEKEPTIKTEFDFSLREQHETAPHRYEGISLNTSYFIEWDTSAPMDQLTGLTKAYRELYEATPEGQEAVRTVLVKDYLDYYPIKIWIDLPNTVWTGDAQNGRMEGTKAGDEAYEYANFQNFFRIPVDPTETIKITVDRDKSNGISTQADTTAYSLRSHSTYTDSGVCYFSIYNRSKNGTVMDTSQIPGGYGLYAFRFGRGDGVYDSGVYADPLQMVYALDENVSVKHLTTNTDQTKLLMFTWEHETESLYLTVINLATMTAEQKIHLYDYDFFHIWEYENFMVLGSSDRIALITADENGKYALRLTAPTPDSIDTGFHYLMSSANMDFDGERLVIIDRLHEELYGGLELCSFYLAVYDEDGLAYYGEYENSLSLRPRYNMYAFNCLPSGANPFRAAWKSR